MRTILQIAISFILIVLVLVQERSGGLSGIFGGGSGTPYYARRGVEKGIFYATIAATVVFAGLALMNLLA